MGLFTIGIRSSYADLATCKLHYHSQDTLSKLKHFQHLHKIRPRKRILLFSFKHLEILSMPGMNQRIHSRLILFPMPFSGCN